MLTAADKDCVKTQSQDLSLYLRPNLSRDEGFMADLAFTLAERRSMHDWRIAVSASSVQELKTALENGDVHLNRASVTPRLGFIFTGQGAQWPAMGQELMVYPAFASALREADTCIRSMGAGWSLLGEASPVITSIVPGSQSLDEITRPARESKIHHAHISQPATTAIQIAIVMLLRTWNIKPSAVLGHSSGEIAAAFSAGILDLGTSMRIAYHRGSLALKLKQRFPNLAGGMLAMGASFSEAQRLVDNVKDAKVAIACMNGPSLVTVSGDHEGIVQLQRLAESEGYFARILHVDVAYHSHHMENVAETYREDLGDVVPMTPHGQETAFYSSLHGRRMAGKALESSYWVANLTNPVLFTQALAELCAHEKDASVDTLLEIGPHSALQAPIQDLFKANTDWAGQFRYLSCLRRAEDARLTLLSAVADLITRGYPVAVSHVNLNESTNVLVDLPSYPWMHKRRHWHESRLSLNHRFRKFPRNDLLGVLVDDVNDLEPRWRSKILLSELPWLRDHCVESTTVFPFAGYISIAIQAAYQQAVLGGQTVTTSSKYILREITVHRSLAFSETSDVELSTTLKRQKDGSRGGPSKWNEFTIYSWTENAAWSEHCHGLVTITEDDGQPNAIDGKATLEASISKLQNAIAEKEAFCKSEVDCDLYYKKIAELGLQFGSNFQGLRAGLAGPNQCIAKIEIPDTAASMPRNFESGLIIHPTTLDSCLQSATLALQGIDLHFSTLYVPTFVKSMSISHGMPHNAGHKLSAYSTARESQSGNEVVASYIVTDAENQGEQPVIEIDGFISSALHRSNDGNPNGSKRGLCYTMQYATCLYFLTPAQYPAVFPLAGQELQGREQTRMAERAAFYFAQTALGQLSTADIEALGGHLWKLYKFLSEKLVQGIKSMIPYQRPEWIHTSDIDKADFLQAVESSSDYGKLVCAMGKNLLAIFRGEAEPLSIMLKDGLLERFYHSNILLDQAYIKCTRWMNVFGHQKPQMRIIEIGAGTGSATVHILNALSSDNLSSPRFATLDYTDISPGFFERAKERFERWGGLINYRRLDIANDPIEQGFEPGSYDLVIASEVLHATAHMDSTMRNVRALVKPGGKVVIIETTLLTMFHNIVFGPLPGM